MNIKFFFVRVPPKSRRCPATALHRSPPTSLPPPVTLPFLPPVEDNTRWISASPFAGGLPDARRQSEWRRWYRGGGFCHRGSEGEPQPGGAQILGARSICYAEVEVHAGERFRFWVILLGKDCQGRPPLVRRRGRAVVGRKASLRIQCITKPFLGSSRASFMFPKRCSRIIYLKRKSSGGTQRSFHG